jgi:transcriptional regulator with XRE-family HTH domain
MEASLVNNSGAVMPDMALRDRIKEAIEGSGKSRADIARACGVTNAAVTHWLDGETKSLKAEKALALEQATGYRALWIANGKGPRRIADPAEPFWPFAKVPIERYMALDEGDKGHVQREMLRAIAECERELPDAPENPTQRPGITTFDLGNVKHPRKKRNN